MCKFRGASSRNRKFCWMLVIWGWEGGGGDFKQCWRSPFFPEIMYLNKYWLHSMIFLFVSQCDSCNMSFSVIVNYIFVFFGTYSSQCLVVWFKMVLICILHSFWHFWRRHCLVCCLGEVVSLPLCLFFQCLALWNARFSPESCIIKRSR